MPRAPRHPARPRTRVPQPPGTPMSCHHRSSRAPRRPRSRHRHTHLDPCVASPHRYPAPHGRPRTLLSHGPWPPMNPGLSRTRAPPPARDLADHAVTGTLRPRATGCKAHPGAAGIKPTPAPIRPRLLDPPSRPSWSIRHLGTGRTLPPIVPARRVANGPGSPWYQGARVPSRARGPGSRFTWSPSTTGNHGPLPPAPPCALRRLAAWVHGRHRSQGNTRPMRPRGPRPSAHPGTRPARPPPERPHRRDAPDVTGQDWAGAPADLAPRQVPRSPGTQPPPSPMHQATRGPSFGRRLAARVEGGPGDQARVVIKSPTHQGTGSPSTPGHPDTQPVERPSRHASGVTWTP